MNEEEIKLKSREGSQVVYIAKTIAGVKIKTIERGNWRQTVHIFEELIPEVIDALTKFSKTEEEK